MVMDDQQLIYSSPDRVLATMEQLKSLGVDQVKVSVVWSLVVPQPDSRKVPSFDATDPGAYPPGAWQRWDLLVDIARRLGIGVYFQITPPAPAWAVATTRPKQGYSWSQKPSASLFGQFVHAVAQRYSGSYVPAGADAPLPRVSEWGIWNEPNEGAWLNPQWKKVKRHKGHVDTAPAMYRALVDSGYAALAATGHAHDAVLVGEAASHGWIYPVPFTQELYCVDSHNRPLKGRSATLIGCPRSGNAPAFAAKHPGLFAEVAYHPYSFDTPPDRRFADHNVITLANLGVFESTLTKIWTVYGHKPHGGVPLYLTEWGYKSNPPNPFVKTSLAEQARWLNEGEYITWKNPNVRALDQFELIDSAPAAGTKPGSRAYWGTFQSGLEYLDGKPKPSYDAFRLPIWLPGRNHRHATVWGQLRPADHSNPQVATLQFEGGGSTTWTNVRQIQTASREGYLLAHVALPAAGNVRLAWTDPSSGTTYHSRAATVS